MQNRKVYDVKRYASYDTNAKKIFIGLREAIIKIYPKDDKGKYVEEIEKIAEEIALDQTDIIYNEMNNIVDEKLSTIMESINAKLNSITESANTTT